LTIHVRVWVKPGSRQDSTVEVADPTLGHRVDLVVSLRERAVDGRANLELVRVLAEHFQVPVRAVCIVGGFRSRSKRVEVG